MKLFLMLVMLLVGSLPSFAKDTALSGTINVNTATAAELMLLPGVGEAKAKTIIDARTAKPFATKEDVLNVKGIGEKTFAQWEPHVAFSGATTLKEVSAPSPTAAPAKAAQ